MSEPILDRDTFQALHDSVGPELTAELLDEFFADAPKQIATMRQALGASDAAAFMRGAHSLKSICATFGARKLSALAKELELKGRAQQLEGVEAALALVDHEYALAEAALRDLGAGLR